MRQEKQFLLDEVKGQISEFSAFVVMSYQGIDANSISDFRDKIASLGGNVEMVKKRVFLKAIDDLGVSLPVDNFPGHISLVLAKKEPVEAIKTVKQFSKENESSVQVIAGHLDGQSYNAQQVEMLATLPSLDGMRAQLLGLLEAPMSQTLSVMNAILTSVPFCLDQKSKQKSE